MAITKITTEVIEDGAITSAKLGSGSVSASSLTGITTDNVSEGSTNVYYTDTRARGSVSVTGGNLSYDSGTGVIQLTTDTIRGAISVTDAGGDGSLAYSAGVITYTGPSAAEVRAHFSAGTGISISSGQISTSQDISTSATPTFGNITTTGYIAGPATFTIDPAAVGDNTGTVVIAGNLQVDGTTTTINSTTVNIDDLNIQLATGAINAAAANGAGITVDGASATITYDSTNDEWDFNKDINVAGQIKSVQSGGTSFATTGVVSDMSGGSYIVVADPQNVVDNTLAGIQFSAFNGDSVIAGTYDSTNNSSIIFGTETSGTITEKMRINSSGKVGIGAVPIQAELHVVDSLTGNNSNISTSSPTVGLFERNGDAEITILGNAANHTAINFSDDTHSAGEIRYVHGTGTDEMRFYTASTQRVVIDSSGNVGIGTTTPSATLVVQDNSFINIDASDATYPFIGSVGSSSDDLIVGSWGDVQICADINGTSGQNIIFKEGGSGAGGTELMRITNGGNVGIGDSSPNVKLVVSEASGDSALAINDDRSNVADYARIDFRHNNITGSQIKSQAIEDFSVDANRTSDLSFHTRNNGTIIDAMYIQEDGNVGIGTTNPGTILDIREDNTGGQATIRLYNTDNSNTTTQTSAVLISPDSRGTTGVGFAAIKENADFSTSAGRDASMAFYTLLNNSATEAMRIDSSGNVGIGTDNPSVGFHYAGDQALFEYTTNAGNESFLKIRSQFDRDVGIAIENNATSQAWKIFIDGGTSGSANGDDSLIFHNTSGHQILSLDQNGYVHIGSSASADRPLHVFASGEAAAIKLTRSDSSKSVELGQGSSFAFLQALNAGGLGLGSSNSFEDLFIGDDGNVFLQGADTNSSTRLVLDGSGGELATTGLLIRTGTNGATNHAGGFIELPNANAEFGIKVNNILSNYTPNGQRYMWGNTTVDAQLVRTPTRGYFDGGTSMSAGEVVVAIVSNDGTSADNHLLELCYAGDDAFTSTEYIFFTDKNGTNGTITSIGNGTVSYNTTSDLRLKENVVNASAALSKIQNVEVKEFNFINYPHVTHTGMLAQDLNEIIPEAVKVGGEDAAKDPWSVDYSKLVPFLIKGMQEQQTIIDDLKARIETLEG